MRSLVRIQYRPPSLPAFMKIFYALETFLPHISGVTVVTQRMAEYFSRNKRNKVYVVSASPQGDFQIDEESRSYTLVRIKSQPNPIRSKLKVSYLAARQIKKILDDFQPDVIHIQDPFFISQALAREAKKRDIPVVASQHCSLDFPWTYLKLPDLFKKRTEKTMAKILSMFFNDYCRTMIVPSDFIKKQVVSWGIDIPVQVVSNGVDLNFFAGVRVSEEFLKKYRIEDFIDRPIVLYSGRLDKDKNLETLLQAIPLVFKEADVNFFFLGDGDCRQDFINQLNANGRTRGKVCFLGPVSPDHPDLVQFYRLASVLVMPSVCEAQSLSVLEAMAAGLPIVAAKSGALPELVQHRKNGILVNGMNAAAYAEAIAEIVKNKNLREKLGKKSLALVAQHDVENTFAALKKIYRQSLSR